MIYIRPFKVSDLTAFVPIEPLDVNEIKDPELAQAIEDSGLAVTGIRDGEIVGCGGVHPIDDFSGEMWLRLSKTCQQYPFDTLRWIKDAMKIIEETFPFNQLYASVQCCFVKSIKLAEYLGFKFARTVEKNGNKYVIYKKLIRD